MAPLVVTGMDLSLRTMSGAMKNEHFLVRFGIQFGIQFKPQTQTGDISSANISSVDWYRSYSSDAGMRFAGVASL